MAALGTSLDAFSMPPPIPALPSGPLGIVGRSEWPPRPRRRFMIKHLKRLAVIAALAFPLAAALPSLAAEGQKYVVAPVAQK